PPQSMMGQALGVLSHPVPGKCLEGLDNAGMEPASALLEDTPIGHLVGEGMLEGVLALGEKARLIEELSGLYVGKAAVEALRGHLDDGLQQGQWYFMANHGGSLQEALGLGWQPVNACGKHSLHRCWGLNGRERLPQTIDARLAYQHPGLYQRSYTLFQE